MESASGEVRLCDITNADSTNMSIVDIPGSKWDVLMLELAGFYFSGKYTWGIVKQLFKFKASSEGRNNVEKDPQKVDFLPKKVMALKTPYPADTVWS